MNKEINNIDGLLICAGFSGRMKKFKPLLDFQGVPFVVEILLKMNIICGKIGIVTGYKKQQLRLDVEKYLNKTEVLVNHPAAKLFKENSEILKQKIEFIHNPIYAEGMFTSLQAGLQKMSGSEWVLYHFVDQPSLPATFYQEFVKKIDENYDWIQPQYNDINGHPIIFNNSMIKAILSSPIKSSLRDLANKTQSKKKFWKCKYPEILEDIDTPGDYEPIKHQ